LHDYPFLQFPAVVASPKQETAKTHTLARSTTGSRLNPDVPLGALAALFVTH